MSQSIWIVTLLYVISGLAWSSAGRMETNDIGQSRVALQNSSGMSIIEARIALRKSLTLREHSKNDGKWMEGCDDKREWSLAPVTDFVNGPDGVVYTDKGTSLRTLFWKNRYEQSHFSSKQNLRFDQLDFVSTKECSVKGHYGVVWPQKNWHIQGYRWANLADAQLFVDAVNAVVSEYRGGGPAREASELVEFQASAKAWRELSVKPALPEETRRGKVLAEEALREKDLEAAIAHFQAGLKSTPLWPEGQFNVALLYAELGDFFFAVQHMRRYLELVPGASDTEAAKDKLIIWESKVPVISASKTH